MDPLLRGPVAPPPSSYEALWTAAPPPPVLAQHYHHHHHHTSHHDGWLPAFSLVFASELLDKTFFTAMLLAIRLGRGVAFTGSMLALALMAVLGASIGSAFSSIPVRGGGLLGSGLPLGELLGTALLAFFGARSLLAASAAGGSGGGDELAEAHAAVSKAHLAGDASCCCAGSARGSSSAAGDGGTSSRLGWQLAGVLQVASLVFVTEWGDPSLLSCICLAARQDSAPAAVALGALGAYAAATALAVCSGSLLQRWLDERTVSLASGALFCLFAAGSAARLLLS